ncbi:MAG TPA: GGDEF domain-containing protein [Candidatus Limnocylindrales bacterium]|nr:GGDEF domain-containing protein [Candidatus Limnocylindrales bacterium]
MPTDLLLLILAIAVAINLVLMVVLIAPAIRDRVRPSNEIRALEVASGDPVDSALIDGLMGATATGGPPAYDRIFRIVSWSFLMITALIVALTGLWADVLPRIVVWIAIGGAFTLVLHDVAPGLLSPTLRGVLQGVAALVFAAVLVVLTGGYASPFAFTFPLIVGGASLVVGPLATALLAIGATLGLIVASAAGNPPPTTDQLAAVAVNIAVMYLLAGIGAYVGREQRRSRDAVLRLSAVDALTGLYNRTFFFVALEREIARSERSGRGFCLIMLDLDELKAINDRDGHHAGDAVLRSVAETVKSGTRRIDVAARYGGDEFVALLPETDPTGGWVLAEKIRLGVAEQDMPGIDAQPTVSVGVVSYPTDGRTADALMLSADRAMYASKRSGKNRVARASADTAVVSIEAERGRGSTGRAG